MVLQGKPNLREVLAVELNIRFNALDFLNIFSRYILYIRTKCIGGEALSNKTAGWNPQITVIFANTEDDFAYDDQINILPKLN